MLALTIKIAIDEFEADMAEGIIASMVIPIVFSILYLPLAYFFALFTQYELAFVRMSFCEPKSWTTRFSHRVRAFLVCNFSLRKVNMLSQKAGKYMYVSMSKVQYETFMRKIWNENERNML